jgi:hypothetical protein
MLRVFLLHLLLSATTLACADEPLPTTLMTTRGKPLASEDFAEVPAPFTGKPVGFASGFAGWRYNSATTGGKSGRW